MPASHRFSRLAMLPVAPVLLVQGTRLRRTTPRLADAAQPWSGTLAGPRPLRLLVLGDSTAAGVGVTSQQDGLPGNLARELSAHLGRGVEWTAIGKNGATARELLERFVGPATAQGFDFVFLTIGANDALTLRSRRAFGRDIRELMRLLRSANPEATIAMSSLPAFFRFESLPRPLRSALYRHSQSLEAEARSIVSLLPRAFMSPPPPPYTDGFFASDSFHPSETGYRDWAKFAIDDAVARGQL